MVWIVKKGSIKFPLNISLTQEEAWLGSGKNQKNPGNALWTFLEILSSVNYIDRPVF